MNKCLKDKTCIVTGAARGIGLAVAERFCIEGARVLLADIDGDLAAKEAARLTAEGRAAACAADISSSKGAAAITATCVENFGGLDVLVNNAAVNDECAFEDITENHWRKVMDVNLDGAMRCTQAALPHLKQSAAASIINIVSTQGMFGQPNAAPYASAKGGLINMTRCMAVDFGSMGIRANAVAPGFIDTRMAVLPDGSHEYGSEWFRDVFIKHGRLPLRRPGVPADIAGPVAFLASEDSAYITGQVLAVDGGVVCTY